MPVFSIKSPEGVEYEINAPEGATQEQAFNFFKQEHSAGRLKPVETKKAPDREYSLKNNPVTGALETALGMATGGVAQPLAGLYGIAKGAFGGANAGADAVRKAQEAMTYSPRSREGKEYSEAVGNVLQKPIDYAGELGGKVGGLEGEALARAATEIGMNFLPVGAIAKGAKGLIKGKVKIPEKLPTVSDILDKEQAVKEAAQTAELQTRQAAAQQAAKEALPQQQAFNRESAMPKRVEPTQVLHESPEAMQRAIQDEGMSQEATRQQYANEMGQQELPFDTTPEAIAAKQAEMSPQMDMFAEDFNRQKSYDPYAEAQRVVADKQSIIDQMKAEEQAKPQADLFQDKQQEMFKQQKQAEIEQAYSQREQQLQQEAVDKRQAAIEDQQIALEEQLRKQAYQAPDYLDVRAARGRQRGGIDVDAISHAVGNLTSKFRRDKVPQVDPITKEQAVAKQQLGNKVAVMHLQEKFPEYSRVQSPQEAMHLYQQGGVKDIKYNNVVRNALISGSEGMLRMNPKNPFLNYARTAMQRARNAASEFSKRYVTGEEGVNKLYKELSKEEWTRTAEAMQELSNRRIDPSMELLTKLGLNEKQQRVVMAFKNAYDALYEKGTAANERLGFEPFEKLAGYSPSVFPGAYKALVMHKDGGVKAVINADTRAEFNTAKQHYADSKIVDLGRRGLNDKTGSSSMFNGMNDLINEIAKNDPEFAKTQAVANEAVSGKIKKLYSFDKHEMKKYGVEGSAGDKPWLKAEDNAKDYFETLINHLEEGAKYYESQEALNGIGSIVNDPTIELPNTKKYLEAYAKHLTGQDLNPVGAASNWIVDSLPKMLGVGPRIPSKFMDAASSVSSMFMMGTYNVAFLGMQLMQYGTGGIPEMLRIRAGTSLPMHEVGTSFGKAPVWNIALFTEKRLGKNVLGNLIPEHIRSAQEWANTHGMYEFSELATAHETTRGKVWNAVEKAGNLPAEYGEKFSRPAVFLAISDLLHKAGLDGDENFLIAQNATDSAMVNYHPDERPMIYQSTGELGKGMGKLSTFKHNFVTQWFTHGQEGAKFITSGGKEGALAPIASLAGMSIALAGISGLPGYTEADAIVKKLTGGKRIRDLLLGADSDKPSASIDGVLSWKTGIDFQSRLGTNRVLPDTEWSSLNPHIANIANMLGKAYDYAKYKDEMSYNEMVKALTPVGMRGFTEDLDNNGQPVDKEGRRIFEQNRTPEEQAIRKWTGLRPIRESVERADNYNTYQQYKALEAQRKEINSRMKAAMSLGDTEAIKRYTQQLAEMGYTSDIEKGLSTSRVEKTMTEKGMTEKQRFFGTSPEKNMSKLKLLAEKKRLEEEQNAR